MHDERPEKEDEYFIKKRELGELLIRRLTFR